MRWLALATLWATLAGTPGCSAVVFEQRRLDAGALPRLDGLAPGTSKAEVLARLGAPLEVLPRAGGDLFVYRLRHVDVDAVNLNTALYLPVFVPLYSHTSGERRSEVVHVAFDEQGRLEHVARREGRP